MKKQTEIKQRSWIDWFCKLIPMSVRITCKTIFIEWRVRLQTIDWTKIPIRFVFSRNSTEAIKLRRQQHSYRWAVVMIVSHTKHSEKKTANKRTQRTFQSSVRPESEKATGFCLSYCNFIELCNSKLHGDKNQWIRMKQSPLLITI